MRTVLIATTASATLLEPPLASKPIAAIAKPRNRAISSAQPPRHANREALLLRHHHDVETIS